MADYADQIDIFMAAISSQESSGNATARNPQSGAYGEFQIMPSNWPSWAQEAGLGRDAPQTAENQRRVARFKMLQYFNQFGSWEAVAIAWFAGPSRAQRYVKGDTSVLTLSDGNMTVGGYIAKMRQGMAAAKDADPFAGVPALPEGLPADDLNDVESSQEKLVALMREISQIAKSDTKTPFDDDQSGLTRFFDSLGRAADMLVPSFASVSDIDEMATSQAQVAAAPPGGPAVATQTAGATRPGVPPSRGARPSGSAPTGGRGTVAPGPTLQPTPYLPEDASSRPAPVPAPIVAPPRPTPSLPPNVNRPGGPSER